MNPSNSIRTAAAVLLFAGFSLPIAAMASSVQPAERPIPGRYIVVLEGTEPVAPRIGETAAQAMTRQASELAGFYGGRAARVYENSLRGFSFEGSSAAAENLARDRKVAYVAEDGWVELAGSQSPVPSWGLDRIDQRQTELDLQYAYSSVGAGVDLYIVDTGIRSTHTDFGGRVDTGNGFTTFEDGLGTEDCNGHGTHVAGIAGGATYGVAKGATIHPVRVVGCGGSGPVSDVIAGVDWITARHQGPDANRAVANLSLYNGYSQPLDDAVTASIEAGIVWVVAAANHGEDAACLLSPQRVPGAITVGATTQEGERWSNSNYGPCVDLFAPGAGIVSTFPRNDDDAIAMTGTSMAAPHVAGAAALLLAIDPEATPDEVQARILASATEGAIGDVGAGSANLLLYSPFEQELEPEPAIFVDGFELGTWTWSEQFPVVDSIR